VKVVELLRRATAATWTGLKARTAVEVERVRNMVDTWFVVVEVMVCEEKKMGGEKMQK